MKFNGKIEFNASVGKRAHFLQQQLKYYSTSTTAAAPEQNEGTVQKQVCDEEDQKRKDQNRKLAIWMYACSGLVFFMIVLGGVTRLTDSGLSIVEWKPLVGVIPPLSHEDWLAEFDKYKQFPEYQKLNPDMTLDEFKYIFYFEWAHRLLGRFIGVAFAAPFVYFASRGYFRNRPGIIPNMLSLFALGGFQGFLGWYMVKSGLQHDEKTAATPHPTVSHYRLAAHLGSAFVIYAALLWNALNFQFPNKLSNVSAELTAQKLAPIRRLAGVSATLLAITILSGALVAGLDAGLIYNEYPKMGGRWVPEGAFRMKPLIKNFFDNDATVQWDHRILSALTLVTIGALYLKSRRIHSSLPPALRKPLHSVTAMVGVQFALGFFTLINCVPVSLGAAHQGGALTLFSFMIWLLHALRRVPK